MSIASWLLLLAAFAVGCQSSSSSPQAPRESGATSQPPSLGAPPPASPDAPQSAAGNPRATNASPSLTAAEGLGAMFADAFSAATAGPTHNPIKADGDCPILYPAPDDEIAAQAKAIVPLKNGLTLSHLWRTIQSEEDIECLSHVVGVGAEAVQMSSTCLQSKDREDPSFPRRTCRTDMRRARVYQTMVGDVAVPETVVGATTYSLSRDAFLELTRDGTTRHRYIELKFTDAGPISRTHFEVELDGALRLEGKGTMTTIVNEAPTELPVLRLSGTLRGTVYGKAAETRVTAAAIDDERFPLMLDYHLLDVGQHEFSLRYTKISYPTDGAIEKRLAEAKTIDVYGIYFDFGSDGIRKESEPILQEIATALAKHPDWTLSIAGHTDNVGSDTSNLDLSQRRSAAVRTALVQRYGIAADRLTTAGHGEGAPRDTNDTPEGRARNRRVELTRQGGE